MSTKHDYSTIYSEIQLQPAKCYNCNCGSTYKYSSGYSLHKVCNFIPTIIQNMFCYILLYDCLLIYENNVVINKNNTLIDILKNQQFTTKTNHP